MNIKHEQKQACKYLHTYVKKKGEAFLIVFYHLFPALWKNGKGYEQKYSSLLYFGTWMISIKFTSKEMAKYSKYVIPKKLWIAVFVA